jgi:hypothetical protein
MCLRKLLFECRVQSANELLISLWLHVAMIPYPTRRCDRVLPQVAGKDKPWPRNHCYLSISLAGRRGNRTVKVVPVASEE